jgi:transcription-repair coupling factor (superfamily II helicase)
VDLDLPALIPDDYLPDVHSRLILYKRIASAADQEELRELQVEMIDRFGLLPEAVKQLFSITELKLKAVPLGISKIDVGESSGRLIFGPQPNVDPGAIVRLIQTQPDRYSLDGSDKIRFQGDMGAPEKRVAQVGKLLDSLSVTAD